ncbi:hypothetical protein KMP13_10105 [Epibacterium ulvae]|uniref:hypothetical protein n=1 Tax=Epibacterium ulvae TaxID=1156985 RepID=UPI001BFC682F|nr:hypothetical protein [Epibacterium ulvae]MBT8154243.1 hypothetical protein [Epibacterium ulvae]
MIGAGDLQAHWSRVWLRAPGVEDATTRVHWMQCGPLYADIRIPLDRPALDGATALCDLAPAQLASLMAAEGFAGTITVVDSICTWARDINWHGTPDGLDAGLMSFDAAGDLIEDGVHADYAELWRKKPAATTVAHRVQGGGQHGVVVFSKSQFLLALGTPDAPASAPLITALKEGLQPDGLPGHFASHYILGDWDGAVGTARLATNPFLERKQVLTAAADRAEGFTADLVDFFGAPQQIALQI